MVCHTPPKKKGTNKQKHKQTKNTHKIIKHSLLLSQRFTVLALRTYENFLIIGKKGYSIIKGNYFLLQTKPIERGNVTKNTLSQQVDNIPVVIIDYLLFDFQEAVNWFSQLPFIEHGGIGVVGVSTGGMVALLIASLYPEKVIYDALVLLGILNYIH